MTIRIGLMLLTALLATACSRQPPADETVTTPPTTQPAPADSTADPTMPPTTDPTMPPATDPSQPVPPQTDTEPVPPQ